MKIATAFLCAAIWIISFGFVGSFVTFKDGSIMEFSSWLGHRIVVKLEIARAMGDGDKLEVAGKAENEGDGGQ